MEGDCKDLIVLVGSNPLATYLATATLRPCRVGFVYSAETREIRGRLADAVSDGLDVAAMDDFNGFVSDATSAAAVRAVVRRIPSRAWLDYTGGTKVMAVHSRLAMAADDARCSYVDSLAGRLRFDNDNDSSLPLSSEGLTIRRVVELHGGVLGSAQDIGGDGPTDEAATVVFDAVVGDADASEGANVRQQLQDVFGFQEMHWRSKLARLRRQPVRRRDIPVDVPGFPEQFPPDGWDSAVTKQWCRFLGKNGWFEVWTANRVRAAIDPTELLTGVEVVRRGDREFEVDVVFTTSHRVWLVSSTTAKGLVPAKKKGFEVAMRGRQLGGDLAASAVVCLNLDGRNENGRLVDQVQHDMASHLDAPNVPRIFGAEDVRAWRDGEVSTLTRWLER